MIREGILKHKEVFDAWLEGKEVEVLNTKKGIWEYISNPYWVKSHQYRVKKEKVVVNGYGVRWLSPSDSKIMEKLFDTPQERDLRYLILSEDQSVKCVKKFDVSLEYYE